MQAEQIDEIRTVSALRYAGELSPAAFGEYVEEHGLAEIAEIFRGGIRVEVGDLLPSSDYGSRLQNVPPAWDLAFEVNASENEAVRASCVEFVLAGLYSMERISRSQRHGKIEYEF